ncbi:MAG: hypothetical protein RL497_307 [Pseudomonadota bacterium]
MLYFGGNAEAVSDSLELLNKAYAHCNLLLMVYRGYGHSDGTPGQQHFFDDAQALYQLRKNKNAKTHFIVVGRSLGSAIATFLAAQQRVDQLVLVTPFDSLSQIAQQKFPWLPTRWLLKHPFPSDVYARAINAPVHIIMAEEDEIIPAYNTLRLKDAFVKIKPHFTHLARVSHNTVEGHPAYLTALGRRL